MSVVVRLDSVWQFEKASLIFLNDAWIWINKDTKLDEWIVYMSRMSLYIVTDKYVCVCVWSLLSGKLCSFACVCVWYDEV